MESAGKRHTENPTSTRWMTIRGARLPQTQSPVVELNRAVAVGMASGPARGLEVADTLTSPQALAGYVQLPAVRGDLLAKLGRLAEARVEFTRAAVLTGNQRERAIFPGASRSLPRRRGVVMIVRGAPRAGHRELVQGGRLRGIDQHSVIQLIAEPGPRAVPPSSTVSARSWSDQTSGTVMTPIVPSSCHVAHHARQY